MRIKDESLKGRSRVADRRRDALDHLVQQGFHAFARFAAHLQYLIGWDAQNLLYLLRASVYVGGWEVYLVEGGDYLKVAIQGVIAVGQRLRLYALGGIHQQNRPFASRQRPRHLIAEIHMPRRVYQIHDAAFVFQAHALELDGDASLSFQIH